MSTTFVHYTPAQNVTCKLAGDVEAGQLVEIAADFDGRNPVVKPAAAGKTVFGVVAHSAKKAGHVMVYRAGHIVDVQATGSIAAGDLVAAGASGKATKAGDGVPVVGQAVSAAVDGFVTVALA
ncbi:MAG: DUF2190 family protein [Corynebacterium glucuronolyticum]|nr:DUF2190 family protein [Corynebacterium glucuronolyticum]